jgi:prevent-host-death family protein
MKTMPLSEVKTKLSELIDAVERRDEVVTITRNGKPVAIIVSKDEYEGWHGNCGDHEGREVYERDSSGHTIS